MLPRLLKAHLTSITLEEIFVVQDTLINLLPRESDISIRFFLCDSISTFLTTIENSADIWSLFLQQGNRWLSIFTLANELVKSQLLLSTGLYLWQCIFTLFPCSGSNELLLALLTVSATSLASEEIDDRIQSLKLFDILRGYIPDQIDSEIQASVFQSVLQSLFDELRIVTFERQNIDELSLAVKVISGFLDNPPPFLEFEHLAFFFETAVQTLSNKAVPITIRFLTHQIIDSSVELIVDNFRDRITVLIQLSVELSLEMCRIQRDDNTYEFPLSFFYAIADAYDNETAGIFELFLSLASSLMSHHFNTSNQIDDENQEDLDMNENENGFDNGGDNMMLAERQVALFVIMSIIEGTQEVVSERIGEVLQFVLQCGDVDDKYVFGAACKALNELTEYESGPLSCYTEEVTEFFIKYIKFEDSIPALDNLFNKCGSPQKRENIEHIYSGLVSLLPAARSEQQIEQILSCISSFLLSSFSTPQLTANTSVNISNNDNLCNNINYNFSNNMNIIDNNLIESGGISIIGGQNYDDEMTSPACAAEALFQNFLPILADIQNSNDDLKSVILDFFGKSVRVAPLTVKKELPNLMQIIVNSLVLNNNFQLNVSSSNCLKEIARILPLSLIPFLSQIVPLLVEKLVNSDSLISVPNSSSNFSEIRERIGPATISSAAGSAYEINKTQISAMSALVTFVGYMPNHMREIAQTPILDFIIQRQNSSNIYASTSNNINSNENNNNGNDNSQMKSSSPISGNSNVSSAIGSGGGSSFISEACDCLSESCEGYQQLGIPLYEMITMALPRKLCSCERKDAVISMLNFISTVIEVYEDDIREDIFKIIVTTIHKILVVPPIGFLKTEHSTYIDQQIQTPLFCLIEQVIDACFIFSRKNSESSTIVPDVNRNRNININSNINTNININNLDNNNSANNYNVNNSVIDNVNNSVNNNNNADNNLNNNNYSSVNMPVFLSFLIGPIVPYVKSNSPLMKSNAILSISHICYNSSKYFAMNLHSSGSNSEIENDEFYQIYTSMFQLVNETAFEVIQHCQNADARRNIAKGFTYLIRADRNVFQDKLDILTSFATEMIEYCGYTGLWCTIAMEYDGALLEESSLALEAVLNELPEGTDEVSFDSEFIIFAHNFYRNRLNVLVNGGAPPNMSKAIVDQTVNGLMGVISAIEEKLPLVATALFSTNERKFFNARNEVKVALAGVIMKMSQKDLVSLVNANEAKLVRIQRHLLTIRVPRNT